MIGELDAGNLHVQFDEGTLETGGDVPRLRPTLRRLCAVHFTLDAVATMGNSAGQKVESLVKTVRSTSLLP